MANYKLGPVIGKLGGAGVETFTTTIDLEERHDHITTINVPPGERWMIAWIADLDMRNPGFIPQNARPYLWVDGAYRELNGDGAYPDAMEASSSVEFSFESRSNTRYHGLTLHLFASPLPN